MLIDTDNLLHYSVVNALVDAVPDIMYLLALCLYYSDLLLDHHTETIWAWEIFI